MQQNMSAQTGVCLVPLRRWQSLQWWVEGRFFKRQADIRSTYLTISMIGRNLRSESHSGQRRTLTDRLH
jgi:hypothetical protein